MSIEDRLINDGSEISMRKERAKKLKDDDEANQTFRPFVRSSSRQLAFARKASEPNKLLDVWENQYKAAGKYNKNLKADLSKDDTALLKEPDEYVFQPNTARGRSSRARKLKRSPQQIKPSLNSARWKPPRPKEFLMPKLRSPYKAGLPSSDAESEEQTFQISVVIGGSKIQM